MATPTLTTTQIFPEHTMDLSSISSTSLGGYFIPSVMPHKLDADHYSAEDLDGVTESLFGTGNMNFLMMQDAQINGAAIGANDAPNVNLWDTPVAAVSSMALFTPTSPSTLSFANTENLMGDNAFDQRDASLSTHATNPHLNNSSANNFNGSYNAADYGDSQFNATNIWGSGFKQSNGTNGVDGLNGTSASGRNGSDGSNGNHGSDGSDGTGGGGDTIINVIDNTVTNITEIINVTEIINLLPPILDSGSDDTDVNVGGGISVGGIDIPLNPILPIEVIIDPVEDLLGDLDISITPNIDLFGDSEYRNDHGDTDITTTLDIDLLDNPLLDINLNIPLDPLEAILGDIDLDITGAFNILGDVASPLFDDFAGGTVGTLTATVGDTVQDLVGTLLGTTAGDPDDTDIALGLPVGNVGLNLDVVENIVGDIDLSITPNVDLFGDGETSNAAGDSDVTVDLGLDVLDSSLLDIPTIDVPLDIVENILGDIDLDIDLGLNLLGDVAPSLLDTVPGGAVVDGLLNEVTDGIIDTVLQPSQLEIEALVDTLTQTTDPIVDSTVTAVNDALSDTTQLVTDILSGDTDALETLPQDVFDTITDTVSTVTDGVSQGLDALVENVTDGTVVENAIDVVESVLETVLVDNILDDLVNANSPTEVITDILTPVTEFTDVTDTVVDLVDDGISQIITDLLSNPTDVLNDVVAPDILSSVTDGITEGITTVLPLWPENTSPLGADAAFDPINNTIDILPDPIGNIVEGLGVLDLGGGGSSSGSNSGGGLLGGLGGLFG